MTRCLLVLWVWLCLFTSVFQRDSLAYNWMNLSRKDMNFLESKQLYVNKIIFFINFLSMNSFHFPFHLFVPEVQISFRHFLFVRNWTGSETGYSWEVIKSSPSPCNLTVTVVIYRTQNKQPWHIYLGGWTGWSIDTFLYRSLIIMFPILWIYLGWNVPGFDWVQHIMLNSVAGPRCNARRERET